MRKAIALAEKGSPGPSKVESLGGGWIAEEALAIGLYSLLAVWFVPLNIPDASRAASLHLAGMWLTFVVSVILIAWLIVRMTASMLSSSSGSGNLPTRASSSALVAPPRACRMSMARQISSSMSRSSSG